MTRRPTLLLPLTLVTLSVSAEDGSLELDRVLATPTSALQHGMVLLERELESALPTAGNQLVIRGNFGPRDYRVMVELDHDGRTILIRPTVTAYEYFDDSKCRDVIDDVRTATGAAGDHDPHVSAARFFTDTQALGPTRFAQLEKALFERMRVQVALVSGSGAASSGITTTCQASLVP